MGPIVTPRLHNGWVNGVLTVGHGASYPGWTFRTYVNMYAHIYIYFFMGVGAVSYCYLKVLEVDSASLNMQLEVSQNWSQ